MWLKKTIKTLYLFFVKYVMCTFLSARDVDLRFRYVSYLLKSRPKIMAFIF